MEEIILEAQPRKESGRAKSKDLRGAGFIPAVVYGEGNASQAIKVSRSQLLKLLHQHGLENVVISLSIKDQKEAKNRPCLIKEIQHDPVLDEIIHIDFHEISLTRAIKINVPVAAKGEPVGVKMEGGSLEHILWEVEVECLPTSIPKEIEVEVSQLKMGEAIQVKDLPVPSGVKILTPLEAVVMSVVQPMKEAVPAAAVEGEVAQEPEVIKEKKEVPAQSTAEAQAAEPKEKKEKEAQEK